MKGRTTPEIDVPLETKVTSLIVMACAILALALIAAGLPQLAAVVGGLGYFAIVERLYRLFVLFRSRRRFAACVAVACVGLCALAAVCWVAYLASPLHISSGS